MLDAIAQPAGNNFGVLGKCERRVARGPSPAVFEHLRQIPVVQRYPGLDAGFEEAVDQATVKVEPAGLDLAVTVGQDARPGEREPVRFQAQVAHQFDVGLPPAVVVRRDVAGIAVLHPAGGVREPIPDAFSLAVVAPRAFDLI